jgi:UDP-N-acetylglucosamine transferase subunit ALG13
MLPFDRLVQAMDLWAQKHHECNVVAQIGRSRLEPQYMEWYPMIESTEYLEHFCSSDVVVAHAGMGTFITAFEHHKPLVMLPRKAELQEHTSDHQIATAKWLQEFPGIEVIYEIDGIDDAISRALGSDGVSMTESGTRVELITTIRRFIAGA